MTKLKLKTYSIIEDAVEKGISYRLNRAHKHTDTPSQETLAQEIERAVMFELEEVIDFENDEFVEANDDSISA